MSIRHILNHLKKFFGELQSSKSDKPAIFNYIWTSNKYSLNHMPTFCSKSCPISWTLSSRHI